MNCAHACQCRPSFPLILQCELRWPGWLSSLDDSHSHRSLSVLFLSLTLTRNTHLSTQNGTSLFLSSFIPAFSSSAKLTHLFLPTKKCDPILDRLVAKLARIRERRRQRPCRDRLALDFRYGPLSHYRPRYTIFCLTLSKINHTLLYI